MDRERATQDVEQWVHDWIGAERRADTAFLEQALADDFLAVGPLGFLLSKQQWIGRHQAGDLRYSALTLDEATVRLYGETAVVIGRQVQDASYRGNKVAMDQLRTTVVLVRQQGRWQLAGIHMSAIAQPPAGARP